MKNKIYLLLAVLTGILFITGFSIAQENKKIPIPTLFSTGVGDNNMPLADGETDPHYTLLVSADERFPGPNAKVVLSDAYPIGAWIQNDNKSKWIAPRTDAGEFNAAGTYIYTLVFTLDGFKPETAEIRGFWTTDNNGIDIIINNKSTGFSTPYTAFNGGFFPFEIKEGFVKGINNISFAVYNGEAPTGLRVVIYGEAEPLEVAKK